VDGVWMKSVFAFFFSPRNLCRIDIPTTHILIAKQRSISILDYLPGSSSLSAGWIKKDTGLESRLGKETHQWTYITLSLLLPDPKMSNARMFIYVLYLTSLKSSIMEVYILKFLFFFPNGQPTVIFFLPDIRSQTRNSINIMSILVHSHRFS